jgi:hypothetical protein
MIDKLTKEQKSRLAEWCDKWIAIGLSTNNIAALVLGVEELKVPRG